MYVFQQLNDIFVKKKNTHDYRFLSNISTHEFTDFFFNTATLRPSRLWTVIYSFVYRRTCVCVCVRARVCLYAAYFAIAAGVWVFKIHVVGPFFRYDNRRRRLFLRRPICSAVVGIFFSPNYSCTHNTRLRRRATHTRHRRLDDT